MYLQCAWVKNQVVSYVHLKNDLDKNLHLEELEISISLCPQSRKIVKFCQIYIYTTGTIAQ